METVHKVWAVHIFPIMSCISNKLGIEWAPTDIPMARRLQTLAAAGWICLALFGELAGVYMFVTLLYSNFWWLALLYLFWMLYDIDISNEGGRSSEWVRNWTWWTYFRDYFPAKLIKTADLDPNRNYLFACFPHGVICSGAFSSFVTNASGFKKLYPGMKSRLICLRGHFLVPFFRELILGMGACSSNSESLLHLLNPKKYKGNCVALMVGGAAEALYAHPGEYKIILSRRKGFIRIAMKAGAPLVPVFTFGETDIFRQMKNPENSLVRRFQEKVRQWTGISPIFPVGRGLFQYSFGLVPMRTPITTVVGAPVEVPRNLDPTDEEVNAIHAEFTKRLVELFESEKSKYLKGHENIRLVIS